MGLIKGMEQAMAEVAKAHSTPVRAKPAVPAASVDGAASTASGSTEASPLFKAYRKALHMYERAAPLINQGRKKDAKADINDPELFVPTLAMVTPRKNPFNVFTTGGALWTQFVPGTELASQGADKVSRYCGDWVDSGSVGYVRLCRPND